MLITNTFSNIIMVSRIFYWTWTLMWRLVTPALLLAILSVTFANHAPMTYGNDGYVYPGWARALGWAVTAASVCSIPAVATAKLAAAGNAGGSFIRVFFCLVFYAADFHQNTCYCIVYPEREGPVQAHAGVGAQEGPGQGPGRVHVGPEAGPPGQR